MLYIGICDDDEGVCAELERMLYDYAEQNKIQMDIDIGTEERVCADF